MLQRFFFSCTPVSNSPLVRRRVAVFRVVKNGPIGSSILTNPYAIIPHTLARPRASRTTAIATQEKSPTIFTRPHWNHNNDTHSQNHAHKQSLTHKQALISSHTHTHTLSETLVFFCFFLFFERAHTCRCLFISQFFASDIRLCNTGEAEDSFVVAGSGDTSCGEMWIQHTVYTDGGDAEKLWLNRETTQFPIDRGMDSGAEKKIRKKKKKADISGGCKLEINFFFFFCTILTTKILP